jgi:hypothetical protein
MDPLRRWLSRDDGAYAPEKKETNLVPVQPCALITIDGCRPRRSALTDVKHRVVFFVLRGTKILHPIFRLAGDERLLDISYFRVGSSAPPPGS